MSKVYIVTSGEYSDYGIDAVFSTKELAEQAQKLVPFSNIEEYELDIGAEEMRNGMFPFVVKMDREGSANAISRSDCFRQWLDKRFRETSCEFYYHSPGILYCYCFAKDEKHAIKIANEKRTQLIALNRWGEDL